MWTPSLANWIGRRFLDSARPDLPFLLPDLPSSAEAFWVWGLALALGRPVLWIGDGPRSLDHFHRDLLSLRPETASEPTLFPMAELRAMTTPTSAADADSNGPRLAALEILDGQSSPIIATCIQGLLQAVPAKATLQARAIELVPGQPCHREDFLRTLLSFGFHFNPETQAPGDAAARGGIVDLWQPNRSEPVRIEFLGDTVESLRTFDPLSQRSQTRLERIRILPFTPEKGGEWGSILDHLADHPLLVWSDYPSIEHHAELFDQAPTSSAQPRLAFDEFLARCATDPTLQHCHIGAGPAATECALIDLDFKPIPALGTQARNALPPDAVTAARNHLLDDLAQQADLGQTVLFYFYTPGTAERFKETAPAPLHPGIHAHQPLSGGFHSASLNLWIVAESDLYGQKVQSRRPSVRRLETTGGARITDWTDMEPGDLVVHVENGIGRYLGLREISLNNTLQEVLAIEYADDAKLYVPVSQAHLLTRYVGVGKRSAPLHRLGGKRWAKEKASAERAIEDMAAELLETQAARESQVGTAFAPDSPWQHEFEASFPFTETPDQDRAIIDTKSDMEKPRPMDRLICGDAGYGKTEVALRAAFKAVLSARQVAVLVPTTVLAQQHFDTFRERMAPFPVTVAMLSRFCTPSEHTQVLAGLRDGSIDIVIGTHGLIQPGVVFRDLGFVIIDEEQRFGVRHKERFKQIRRMVDVLTLTATPIPRTLYLSLTGARDLSTIQTPPQERQAVETIVARDSDEVLRAAILRELNREGQVFFIHNRIMTIDRVRERLHRLVPEARIEIAHGRMPAAALAEIMDRFVRNECDILLSTTIVESGMDIPNANTILIDRADRFGLAELYQLRGRVGRASCQAYAYLLLPHQAGIDPIARKRIQAITQHSALGAGFRLALRDLEIRGAGNLLGSEQSGHIGAVGFGLYCQLLKRTIARQKGEELPPLAEIELRLDFIDLTPASAAADNSAAIPIDYIDDERLRVSLYRKLAECSRPAEVDRLRDEFSDRFGPRPPAVERLLLMARLRIAASRRGLTSLETREDRILATRGGQLALLEDGLLPRLKNKAPAARLRELIRAVEKL